MFSTNLLNANVKDSSWFLREAGCVFSEKKVWGMDMYFIESIKGDGVLELAISE